MVLCFEYTPKTIEQLQKEFKYFVNKKFETNKDLSYEMIIPKSILEYSQALLNEYGINSETINKEIYYKKFKEDGPEDIYPPIEYEYERPCITFNGKEYKLRDFRYDVNNFKNEYVILKTN